MSESKFYAEQLARFRQEHPQGSGWLTFEARYSGIGLDDLPDFLAQTDRSANVKMSVTRGISRDTAVYPPADDNLCRLKEHGWIGDIEFDWEGSTIRARGGRFYAEMSGVVTVIFLAARSRPALESMASALRAFRRAKMQRDKIIQVIGGPELPRPRLSWDDLCLPKGMAADIRAASETFFRSKEKYRRFGLAYRRGFLLSGPPGCGKTQTAKVIASTITEAACISYTAKAGARESDQLQDAFAIAEGHAPSILILEDLDKIDKSVPISLVLNLLDGLENPRGVLVIASTNEPEKLDPALLLRPSRFDRVWNFPLPDYEQRRVFLTRKSGGGFSEEVINEIARLSQGFSMAYVQEIFASAVAYSIRDDREPEERDLLEAVKNLSRQIKDSRNGVQRIGRPNEGVGFRCAVES